MYIRNAVATDLYAIVSIYNASIPSRLATADLNPISVDSRQEWFEQHSPHTYPIWVMEQKGEIAGWLSFSPFYGRPAYRATAEISIYVDPAYQRQRVAYQLLSQAIDYSPSLGLQTLLGFIFAHNHPSLRLFELFNFQVWGHLPQVAELDEIKRDLVILGLKIT
ncbi:GNAT family N-acetyltransferase [Aliterella atlantica]|uniref:Phosphinothricin acetyltransferase n=1 Tax=Aliterella atlantica CENA595 TaxID=1618023 RepID=A0A0D8ZTF3_9CYAN|nr:GNAT family N-acetyltransferase [Aliterella atlantica]KJH72048.1 phosphinothricin acetyltransferase [Aliterella atlantica CENA595]